MDDNKDYMGKEDKGGEKPMERPVPQVVNNIDVDKNEGKNQQNTTNVDNNQNVDNNVNNSQKDIGAKVEELPESAENSAKKPVIAFSILAALAAVLTAGVVYSIYNTPQRVVERAFVNTCSRLEERPNIFKAIGLDRCTFMDTDSSCSLLISSALNNNSFDKKFNGAGAKITMDIDGEGQQVKSDVSATYGGAELVSLNLYSDNEIIQLAAPAFFDEIFQFNAENVMSQFENSPLYPQELPKNVGTDFSLKFFDENKGIAKNPDVEQMQRLAEKSSETFGKNFASIKENIAFDKYDTKSFNIGGTETACKGYAVTIGGNGAKTALFNALKEVMATEEYKKTVSTYLLMDYNQSDLLQSTYSTPFEYCNEALSNMNSLIEYMDKNLTVEDIKVYIYVHDGYIVNASVSSAVNGTAVMNIDLTADLAGEENPFDALNAKLCLTKGSSWVIYEYKDRAMQKNDAVENMLSFSLTSNNEPVYDFELLSSYNSKNGDFSGSLTANATYSEEITLKADGNIIADADAFSINLDRLCLEQGESLVDISFDFEVTPLKAPVTKPEGRVLEIFGKDSQEALQVIEEAKTKNARLYSKILSNVIAE